MLNVSRELDTYTPTPSNGSSSRVLSLFSRWASYLDAFSTYPLRRSCPACLVRQPVDQRPRFPVPFVLEDPSYQTISHFQ